MSASSPPGRRERNKLDKEARIRAAARELFIQKGYEATTFREVADRADVGFGTVFAYAVDKAGLLAMVYIKELEALPPLFEELPPGDILDELVSGLSRLYEFWARIPSLSRHVLEQMEFFGDNPHMEAILARRIRARDELTGWLERTQAEGRVVADLDLGAAADTLFAIYTSAVREWSVVSPDAVGEGVKRLRALMVLPIRGLRP